MMEFSWVLEVVEQVCDAHEGVNFAPINVDVVVVGLNGSLCCLDVVGDGDVGVEACAGTLADAHLCVVGSAVADRDAADAHRVVVGVGRRRAC